MARVEQVISEKDILLRAIDELGIDARMDMMLEEMSELAKALLKVRRAERANLMYDDALLAQCDERVREEIADVQIMLDQMKLIYDHDGIVDHWREKKLDRLERILDRRCRARSRARERDASKVTSEDEDALPTERESAPECEVAT